MPGGGYGGKEYIDQRQEWEMERRIRRIRAMRGMGGRIKKIRALTGEWGKQ